VGTTAATGDALLLHEMIAEPTGGNEGMRMMTSGMGMQLLIFLEGQESDIAEGDLDMLFTVHLNNILSQFIGFLVGECSILSPPLRGAASPHIPFLRLGPISTHPLSIPCSECCWLDGLSFADGGDDATIMVSLAFIDLEEQGMPIDTFLGVSNVWLTPSILSTHDPILLNAQNELE